MSKKNKDKRKEKLLTKEVNILEVNKSCFKDCFYSSSHEHVFTLSFLYFLHPHKVPPHPLKPRNPASFPLSIAWVSIVFVFRVLVFVSTFFFLWFRVPRPLPQPHPTLSLSLQFHTPSFIVLFFSSFFFYLSLSLCSKRAVPLHRRSLTCAVETYQFSPGSGREEEHHLNILCLFLTGSLSVCVCARRERGGTTRGTVAEGFLNMI